MLAGLDPREVVPTSLCVKPGAVADLPEPFARQLIDGGYAEAVDKPADVAAEIPLPPPVQQLKEAKRGRKGRNRTDAPAP